MPRLPRLHVSGALSIVTSQGVSSEPLFHDQQDYDTYLTFIAEYKQRHAFKLFAYCLLPDQARLCLEAGESATVSMIMHDLTSRYTKYYNRRYQRTGHLFQARFKSALAEKPSCLLPLTVLLHRDPVHSGASLAMFDYPYSSAQAYRLVLGSGFGAQSVCPQPAAQSPQLDLRAEIQEVMALLPPDAAGRTPEAYERYVTQLSVAELDTLEAGLRHGRVGSTEFLEAIEAQLKASCGPQPQPQPTPQPAVFHSSLLSRFAFRRIFREPVVLALLAVIVGMGIMSQSLRERMTSLEQMLASLAQENEAAFRARVSVAFQDSPFEIPVGLDQTQWEVLLMSQDQRGTIIEDELAFIRHQFSSRAMAIQQFSSSAYASTTESNGVQVWEATQTSPASGTIQWRGQREGTRIRGVMTRQQAGQSSEQFTFIGMIRLAGRPMRSEI